VDVELEKAVAGEVDAVGSRAAEGGSASSYGEQGQVRQAAEETWGRSNFDRRRRGP
jgi:hypothetical protein